MRDGFACPRKVQSLTVDLPDNRQGRRRWGGNASAADEESAQYGIQCLEAQDDPLDLG